MPDDLDGRPRIVGDEAKGCRVGRTKFEDSQGAGKVLRRRHTNLMFLKFIKKHVRVRSPDFMKKLVRPYLAVVTCLLVLTGNLASAADNPFVGNWALTLPGGYVGWLGITQEKNYLDGAMLWRWGSVTPLDSVFLNDKALVFTQVREVQRKNDAGKVVRTHRFTDRFVAQVQGDTLSIVAFRPHPDGSGVDREELKGKRIPPLPPAPDLAKVKFREPVKLFNGKDLTGWKLVEPDAVNGWSAQDGRLSNRPVQVEGQPHKNYGNLRTEREFEDFNLTLEVSVPKDGNSGIYLKGLYEVQVADTFGRGLDSHNMGAIYSRITPAASAEKPAGEWQSLDITLVNRHVTVVLNGKTIINNQPVLGITGGALTADEFKPGPIYLQGDHAGVEYRNVIVREVAK